MRQKRKGGYFNPPFLFKLAWKSNFYMFDNIDLKDAVRRAMQTEKNAMDFYKRGAEMMKNAEAKKVFELLAREESEHAEWFYNVYPGDDRRRSGL
jgi:rubrerythrin